MTDQNPTNPSSSPSSLGKPSPSTQGVAATMPSSAQQSPTPSSLNPVAPAFGTDGRILAQPGHIWLSAKQGQAPWPVVICDEQMLQILWKGVQRPENARMADGRWPKEYRPGGKLEGRVAFPTMRLGTMKLCWTPWSRLKPFYNTVAFSAMESTTDELLKKAYMEAIEQHGRVDLTYWKDTLLVKKLQSDEDSDLKKGAADKAKVKDEVTDDVKVKQEKDGSIPKRKVSAMGFVYPPAIDLGRYSKDNIKMEVGDSLFLDGDNGVVEDERESPKRRKDNNGVAVTPPQKVKPQASSLLTPKPDANDFETVAGLMKDPCFVCTDPLRLAKACSIAGKLEMGSIRQTCWRRFRILLLEPPSKELLGGIEAIIRGGVEDEGIRARLTSYVAGHFWDVIREDMESLKSLLKVEKAFTKAVLDEVTFLLIEGGSSLGSKKRATWTNWLV